MIQPWSTNEIDIRPRPVTFPFAQPGRILCCKFTKDCACQKKWHSNFTKYYVCHGKCKFNDILPHSTTLYYIPFYYILLHSILIHSTALFYILLEYILPHLITFQFGLLHFIAFCYILLHSTTFYYIVYYILCSWYMNVSDVSRLDFLWLYIYIYMCMYIYIYVNCVMMYDVYIAYTNKTRVSSWPKEAITKKKVNQLPRG